MTFLHPININYKPYLSGFMRYNAANYYLYTTNILLTNLTLTSLPSILLVVHHYKASCRNFFRRTYIWMFCYFQSVSYIVSLFSRFSIYCSSIEYITKSLTRFCVLSTMKKFDTHLATPCATLYRCDQLKGGWFVLPLSLCSKVPPAINWYTRHISGPIVVNSKTHFKNSRHQNLKK